MDKKKLISGGVAALGIFLLISFGRFSANKDEVLPQNLPASEPLNSDSVEPWKSPTSSSISDEEYQNFINERTAPMEAALKEYQINLKNQCKEIEFSSPCSQTIILKDEVSESSTLKMSAQATQADVYEKQAAKLSDEILIQKLKEEFNRMSSPDYVFSEDAENINLDLGLSVHLIEARWHRKLNDPILKTIEDAMFNKFGPCWGIPYGWCLE